MAWGTADASTQLTLTGTYAIVQRSAVDWEVTLNPGELAQVMLDFNPQATPTENCDVVIETTTDGTLYESSGEAQRHIIEYSNREGDDPAIRMVQIVGVYGFRIKARVRDTDDTAGGDDTTSTLDVDVRKDGVSI